MVQMDGSRMDRAAVPVKGVVDGLAVDGRGNGVGEAFAVMRFDFAGAKWGVFGSEARAWSSCLLSALVGRHPSISRSGRDSSRAGIGTIFAVSL